MESKFVRPVRFVLKASIVHTLTYIACGMVFSQLFKYGELFKLGNAAYFMREAYGVSSLYGPLFQLVRGALFGLILLLFRDSVWGKSFAALRLWAIVAGLGIVCTPGPSPFSIEGFIYSQLPLEFQFKIAPELLVQTLLFSLFMTREKTLSLSKKNKTLLVSVIIAAAGFSAGGIILTLVLGADFMAAGSDAGAYAVMAAALLVVFFAVRWYLKTNKTAASIAFYALCYVALAVFPTVYNFAVGSLLASPWSLVFSGLSLPVIALYLEREKRR